MINEQNYKKILLKSKIKNILTYPFKVYDFYNTDIFMISYPKCGRTWLRMLMGKYLELKYNITTDNPMNLKQFNNLNSKIPSIEVSHDGNPHYINYNSIVDDKNKFKDKKVILLIRDPRDVVVSYYFQYTKRGAKYQANDASFNGSVNDFTWHNIGGIKSIINYYNVWAKYIDNNNMLTIKYEDLHNKVELEMIKVIEFCGFDEIDKEILRSVIDYSSFDNMRKMEENSSINSTTLKQKIDGDSDSYKTRKGQVHGYLEYYKDDELKKLETEINNTLDEKFYYYKYYSEKSQ